MRERWFRFLGRTINPWALRRAREGAGRFWIIRHRGRVSGTEYETPVILARVAEGFVCELTYGERVQWYRNIVAAGGCEVQRGSERLRVVAIEPLSSDDGLSAFRPPETWILRLLRRREFRLLRTSPSDPRIASEPS